MARYNYFKEYEKAAKWIAKDENLFIQRDGDIIYVSNTHYLIKMYKALYDGAFRTVSPRFIDMVTDGTAGTRGDKKALPVMSADGKPDFRTCIPDLFEYQQAYKTQFIMDPPVEKCASTRLFAIGGNMAYVNEEYYKNLSTFGIGEWYGKNKKSPVLTDFSLDTAVMLLPVNINDYDFRFTVIDTDVNSNTLQKAV